MVEDQLAEGRQWAMGRGQEWMAHGGHLGSAYGTEHPVDISLGKLRRLKDFKRMAKGQAFTPEQRLHESRSMMQPQTEVG